MAATESREAAILGMTRIAVPNKTTSGPHVITKEAETTVEKATPDDISMTGGIIGLAIEQKEPGSMTATMIIILVSVEPPAETNDGHRVEVGAM